MKEILEASLKLAETRARIAGLPQSNLAWVAEDPLVGFLSPALAPNSAKKMALGARLMLLRDLSKRNIEILVKNGISVIPAKGVALVSLYDPPELRPVTDIDLIVPVEQFRSAIHILLKEGLTIWGHTSGGADWIEALSGIDEGVSSKVHQLPAEATLVTLQGIMVDLHWHISPDVWFRQVRPIDMKGIWSQASLESDGSMRLSDEHTLAYAVFNLARNAFASFHSYLDIHALVQNKDSAFWENFIETCDLWRIKSCAFHSFRAGSVLCGTKIPDWILRRLAPPKVTLFVQNLWLRPIRLLKWPQRPITDRYIWATQIFFMDSLFQTIHLLIRMIWPKRDWLIMRYQSHSVLNHWLNLLRIIRSQRPTSQISLD